MPGPALMSFQSQKSKNSSLYLAIMPFIGPTQSLQGLEPCQRHSAAQSSVPASQI